MTWLVLVAEPFAFKLVTLSGYPTPVGGVFATFFDTPSVNNFGDVVFLATVSGGRAAAGVFLYSQGEISTVAAEGQLVPGSGGATFNSFRQAAINNRRQVAFIATVQEGSSLRTGLFLVSAGMISIVGLSGQMIPQMQTPLTFRNFSVNDFGAIAFSSDSGILLFSDGAYSRIPSGSGANRPSLNDRGEIVFIETTTGFRGSPSGVYIALFSPSSGASRTIFSGSGSLAADVNDSGLVAFSGCQGGVCGIRLYEGGTISAIETSTGVFGPPQINNHGIVSYANGESFQGALTDQLSFFDGKALFRIRGDAAAPVSLQGARFIRFGSPSLSDSGAAAFIASVGVPAPSSPTVYEGIFVAALATPNKLYFPHFGNGSDGAVYVFSQITLVNPDSGTAASVSIEINDDHGDPLPVSLNGIAISGRTNVTIPAGGKVTLRTDGLGPIRSGSVTITSDVRIDGVLLYGGSTGLAGVGDSRPMRGLIAPIETGAGMNCGVALMGLGEDQIVQLELRDEGGALVARGSLRLGARTHVSRFVTELPWDTPLDLTSFSGTLTVIGTAPMAGIVLRQRSGELATLPVTEKP